MDQIIEENFRNRASMVAVLVTLLSGNPPGLNGAGEFDLGERHPHLAQPHRVLPRLEHQRASDDRRVRRVVVPSENQRQLRVGSRQRSVGPQRLVVMQQISKKNNNV